MEVSDEPPGAAEGRYEEVVDQLDCHWLLCLIGLLPKSSLNTRPDAHDHSDH
jgi:hypothetical protein